MSAADRLGGYASGFGDLNAEAIAANVDRSDYKLLHKDGAWSTEKTTCRAISPS